MGFANSAAYVAAKHGLLGLTKTAAMEYAQQGIRVNAVGPAFIDTPLLSANLTPEVRAGLAAMHPMGRLGTPAEVSALTCFLLSDRASFITGSYHRVDGGLPHREKVRAGSPASGKAVLSHGDPEANRRDVRKSWKLSADLSSHVAMLDEAA